MFPDLTVLQQTLTGPLFRHIQTGRYMSLVSLAEAETIRRIMHVRKSGQGLMRLTPWNRSLTILAESVLDGAQTEIALRYAPGANAIIDQSQGYRPCPSYQDAVATQMLKFFDCDMYYSEHELKLVLAAVQRSDNAYRKLFFHSVLGCRRRASNRIKEVIQRDGIAAYLIIQGSNY